MSSSLLGKISNDLLIPKDRLDYLMRSAPYRYKVYQIPKKSGQGHRTIAQPAKVIKNLQYWVIENIFPSFPLHSCATAYVRGKNILSNALEHSQKPYILKLDFQDFFPSIKGNDFLVYLGGNEKIDFPEGEAELLMKLLFWYPTRRYKKLQLSIGAPSSPHLSNAIMYDFDSQICEKCNSIDVSYTRYADDLTFSMNNSEQRKEILNYVKYVLNSLSYPKLKLNSKKTIFGSKANRRLITGLILSNDNHVSIGREKKRLIRAQIHHAIRGKLDKKKKEKLRGMIAFAKNIEPDFMKRMEKTYGQKAIKDI